MIDNDDNVLGDQFDEQLTLMIKQLTHKLQKAKEPDQSIERGKAAVSGKRDLMNLLVEKTLEYLKQCDPNGEIVVQEIAMLYDSLIETALNLA